MCNNENGQSQLIQAQKWEVFEEYADIQNTYAHKFDIAIVLLESNPFEDQLKQLKLEWSYKSWKEEEKVIRLAGYPQRPEDNQARRRFNLEKSSQHICKQE